MAASLTLRRTAALAVVAGIIVVVASLTPARGAVTLLASGDVGAIRAWVLGFGVWAPIASVALMLLQTVVAPLPSSPITFANGLVFGVWWGALLSWSSALGSAAVAFGLSRAFGRPVAERLATRAAVAWSDAFFARWGLWAMLVGRMLPVVSFDVISYAAGLTPMRFGAFLLATAIGMIPGTLLYAWLGHLGGRSAAALLWTLAALTALGALAVAFSPAATRWLAAPRRLVNRLTARGLNALPMLGRLWARSARTAALRDVPWTDLRRPLRACRAAIITTGGVHRTVDRPFDMTNPDGDPSFRVIPATAAAAELTITHDYYDHRDADRDLNLVFPLERLRELVEEGVLGGLTRSHFSFMGHVDGLLVRRLEAESIPRLLAELGAERPDFVFLVPA